MTNGPVDRDGVMAKINAAFSARDSGYNDKHDDFRDGLEELNSRMNALIASKNPRPVSQQISLEAQWLINYSDDWDRATETLKRFEASLGDANQTVEQQPDGSWGPGCTEFYRKLEPTIDALQGNITPDTVLKPLAFMQDLQNPKYVNDYLERLRVSRIRQTGRNNRDEFGSIITSLSQLFFKKSVRDVLDRHQKDAKFVVSDESFASFRDYLWRIQGKDTGYWGPSYDFDGDAVDVQDLSFTFHVVKYYYDKGRRNDLPNTAKIVETTKAIEGFYYPNGLKPDPPEHGTPPDFSDHNNYDLVTMFQQLWNGMPEDARAGARDEITTLLGWCLTESLDGDAFEPSPDMSMVDSYYYGVEFLLLAGFWPQQKPFWTNGAVPVPAGTPSPAKIAETLLTGFKTYDDNSSHARDVKAVLTAAQGAAA